MKLSNFLVVAIASVVIAAPVPDAKSEAAGYGDYPTPKGGYGTYGTYGAVTPAPPAKGYGTYGDYKNVPAPPAGAPAKYGSYPPPAGGYGTYGSYKRVIDNLVKRVFG